MDFGGEGAAHYDVQLSGLLLVACFPVRAFHLYVRLVTVLPES